MENAIFLSLITTRSTQEASMLWKMHLTFSKLDISQTIWKKKLHIVVCDLVVCCMYILQYINQMLWNRWWTNPQSVTRIISYSNLCYSTKMTFALKTLYIKKKTNRWWIFYIKCNLRTKNVKWKLMCWDREISRVLKKHGLNFKCYMYVIKLIFFFVVLFVILWVEHQMVKQVCNHAFQIVFLFVVLFVVLCIIKLNFIEFLNKFFISLVFSYCNKFKKCYFFPLWIYHAHDLGKRVKAYFFTCNWFKHLPSCLVFDLLILIIIIFVLVSDTFLFLDSSCGFFQLKPTFIVALFWSLPPCH